MEVTADSLKTSAWELPVATAAPAIFNADATGRGTPAGITGPVARGATIDLWLTGQGTQTRLGAPRVTIGTRTATVLRSEDSSGLLHVVVQVSEDAETGNQPIVVTLANAPSQPGVGIFVQ